jgi:hypothetical protein
MTFEGHNPDFIAGISVFILFILYKKERLSKTLLLVWNVGSILLLLNIIVMANLSSITPMQQFGLEQPNIAFKYFPVAYLPCFIAPAVLFSHIAIFVKLRSGWPISKAQ